MNTMVNLHVQRGVTLVIGLILLVVITIAVSMAFTLSNNSLLAVGNMQFRNEAISAGNLAIETVINSPFTAAPAAETINVDLNNDGVTDYTVTFPAPSCIAATVVSTPAPSSLSLPATMSTAATWETLWEINATVSSAQNTGAAVNVHEGVRVLLTDAQKTVVCP